MGGGWGCDGAATAVWKLAIVLDHWVSDSFFLSDLPTEEVGRIPSSGATHERERRDPLVR